jgi:hypothetical protein
MKLYNYVLPCLALGMAALVVVPAQESLGYTCLNDACDGLGVTAQRDVRVFNNFKDAYSNDNTTIDPQFPGWDGAELAIWKSCVEWGSQHGDGSGDPTQTTIGSGGSNFEAWWTGSAIEIGIASSNIISQKNGCNPGVLAFCEAPIANGWRIRFCDHPYVWHDGPGDNPTGSYHFDIQGVGTHEYGHALGLGHTSTWGATMYPSTSSGGSSDMRSIESDDIAGVQAIYGAALTSHKPHIDSAVQVGDQVLISGYNFSATDCEVWFTNKYPSDSWVNHKVRVTGVTSTGGGTTIQVTIPDDAGPGDVIVKRDTNYNASISNPFPFDGAGAAVALIVDSVTPSTIENLVPGTAETITITGSGFDASTTLELDYAPLAGSYSVVNDTTITFEWEPMNFLGDHYLVVRKGVQAALQTLTAVANATPTLQVGNGDPGNVVSGSVPVKMAGPVDSLQLLLASTSPVASILPGKITLDMGTAFQDVYEIGFYVMDARGMRTPSISISGIQNTTIYWQSLNIDLPISTGWPMEQSNLQETYTP